MTETIYFTVEGFSNMSLVERISAVADKLKQAEVDYPVIKGGYTLRRYTSLNRSTDPNWGFRQFVYNIGYVPIGEFASE